MISEIMLLSEMLEIYEAYAAAGTTYWQSTTEIKLTVPENTRWFIIGGTINTSQNGTLVIEIYNASDELLTKITEHGAGTGAMHFYRSQSSANQHVPVSFEILDEGDYILCTFGAAQDTNAYIGLRIIEVLIKQ